MFTFPYTRSLYRPFLIKEKDVNLFENINYDIKYIEIEQI